MRVLTLLTAPGLAVSLLAAAPGGAVDAERQAILSLLHDGRFDEADRLAEHREAAGDRHAGAFFRAFTSYWRLLYDEDNEALRAELGQRLDRVIEIDEADDSPSDGGEAALWNGSAYLLRAQLRALEKKVLAAGFDAKKAHRSLREAVAAGTKQAESDFGLGTYEYFASAMPGVVRFLRRVLTLPGGNREQGLARLETAAEASHYFALEARLLLQRIYADDEERLYDRARDQAQRTLKEYPDTIAPLHAAARLELSLARHSRALELLDRALERGASRSGVAPSVTGVLRYWAGVAELERFRPDRALAYVEPIIQAREVHSRYLLEKVDRLAGSARAAASLGRAREALELERQGRLEESIAALEELSRQNEGDPLLELLLGRAQLLGGRDAARATLDRAARAEGLPDQWRGTSRLLAGLAADLSGRREPALTWYKSAAELRFTGRDAARLCLTRVCTRADLDLRPGPG